MQNSERHHYIPRFLIKNFTDTSGNLYVYDKSKDRINSKPPKSIFFEWNRNTLNHYGGKSDAFESLYSDIDNQIAPVIEKILSTHKFSGREQGQVLLLAELMRWRTPQSDILFNSLKETLSISDLGVKYVPVAYAKDFDEQKLNKLPTMEAIREMTRILLAAQPFWDQEHYEEVQKGCILITEHNTCPNLLGDCGLIGNRNPDYRQITDLILPLSTNDTFLFKKGAKRTSFINDPVNFHF